MFYCFSVERLKDYLSLSLSSSLFLLLFLSFALLLLFLLSLSLIYILFNIIIFSTLYIVGRQKETNQKNRFVARLFEADHNVNSLANFKSSNRYSNHRTSLSITAERGSEDIVNISLHASADPDLSDDSNCNSL